MRTEVSKSLKSPCKYSKSFSYENAHKILVQRFLSTEINNNNFRLTCDHTNVSMVDGAPLILGHHH